jgi:hypothetical protein
MNILSIQINLRGIISLQLILWLNNVVTSFILNIYYNYIFLFILLVISTYIMLTRVICENWSLNPKDVDQLFYHQATPLVMTKQ